MHRKYQQMYFRAGKDRLLLTYLFRPIAVKDGSLSLAGFVRSKLFPEDLALVIDHSECPDYEYACAAIDFDGHSRILLERRVYWDFLRGKPYARTSVFHELGHIYNNDLSEITNSTEYYFERFTSIQSGTVHMREVRADSFAANFLGASKVGDGLAYIRQQHYEKGEESKSPAIVELDRRILRLIEE